MAVITNLKTRISLRNDNISAWENTTNDPVVLRKGEVALGRLSGNLSDYYEMRIGVGGKKWTDLSGSNVMFKAENISDLSDYIQKNAPKAQFFEASSYSDLSTENVPHGSVAVVKETVVKGEGEGATSVDFRTAYWFDASLTSETNTNGTWRQMDGNYKAENVYFTDNLRLTEQFGRYKAVNEGYTLSCKNMSLDAVLKDAYAETKQPTITQPAVSFTLNKKDTTGEVGDTYTLPTKATFKFDNAGSYTYGPKNTGVLVSADLSADTKTGMSNISRYGMVTNNTVEMTTTSITSAFTDSTEEYTYTAVYSYNAGVTPYNNIGGAATVEPISAVSEKPITAKFKATGYRMMFYGTKNAENMIQAGSNGVFVDNYVMKSEEVRALGNSNNGKKTYSESNAWTIPAGTKQIIFAIPASYGVNGLTVNDVTKTTGKFEIAFNEQAQADVKGRTEDTPAVKYKIFAATFGNSYEKQGKLTVSYK